jgi:hypothetical protein
MRRIGRLFYAQRIQILHSGFLKFYKECSAPSQSSPSRRKKAELWLAPLIKKKSNEVLHLISSSHFPVNPLNQKNLSSLLFRSQCLHRVRQRRLHRLNTDRKQCNPNNRNTRSNKYGSIQMHPVCKTIQPLIQCPPGYRKCNYNSE